MEVKFNYFIFLNVVLVKVDLSVHVSFMFLFY